MAKGAFLAVKRGKLGDSVGYTVSNSNNKDKQGWRIYQPVVANPQTDRQIDQRLKMTAVNNLYRALKEVIIRGWQNHTYGDESRRAFLKVALGSQSVVPVLPKGATYAVPIKGVPITYGSLPSVGVSWYEDEEYYTLRMTIEAGRDISTISGVSQVFIDSGYKAGDQVTIVSGLAPDSGDTIAYRVFSFFLDVTDTRSVSVAFEGQLEFREEGDQLMLNLPYVDSMPLTALLVSVSRDGDGQHLRSTEYFAIADDLERLFYGLSPDIIAQRKATYRKARAESLDWEQVPSRAGVASYTTTAADGTPVTLAGVSQTAGYWVVVNDAGEEFFIKGTDVRSITYNRYLIAKTGTRLDEVWSNTAPAGAVSDSTVNFDASSEATESQLNLYYFLLSQGFDARALLGALQQ